MSAPQIRGWCPGAYTPMRSGDGLILRVRPRMARLSAAQVRGLCAAAIEFANGAIELTNRANLQLRGVTEAAYGPLVERLLALNLLDGDPDTEARRNIVVTPFWQPGDLSERLGLELIARLGELPGLPAKFGFAVDCGAAPVLTATPADIRLERGVTGGVVLRADGATWGRSVAPDRAVNEVIALTRWFATRRDDEHRRMAHLSDRLPTDWKQEMPVPASAPVTPGRRGEGLMQGTAFGSMSARALDRLMRDTGAACLVVTPWRMILLPGATKADTRDFIADADSALLRAHACPGAPSCATASVETRALAATLADRVGGGTLHVSGCAKGCAHPAAADWTLVGRDGAFDLVRNGAPWDEPVRRSLSPGQAEQLFGE